MKFAPNLEADYRADLGPEKIRVLRLISALGSFMYLSFGALDYWAIPSAYCQAWAIRAVVIALTLLLLFLTIYRPQLILSNYTAFVWSMNVTWGVGIVVMISLAKQSDLAWSSYYCGLMLVCSGFAISYLTFLPILMAVTAIVCAYIVVAIWIQGMLTSQIWPLLLMNCYFLISATIIGVVLAGIRERYTRELYLLRQTLHRDMEMTKEAKRQSDYLADHDMLTEMPNRISLMRRLESMIEHAKNVHKIVAVLFLDLNDFKPINDRHGHQVGDMVLKIVAQRIRSCVRALDLFARLGGDEFVVAMELDYMNLLPLERLRQDLKNSIASPMTVEGFEVSVAASIGMAVYPFDVDDATKLIRLADRRMYDVKRKNIAQLNSALPLVAMQNTNGTETPMASYQG
jgi:diguanylate cyclase (GGDEF)-like protein